MGMCVCLDWTGLPLNVQCASLDTTTPVCTSLACPSTRPAHNKPAQCDGAFAVFEPRYLELFRSLQASSAPEPSFGHILAGSAAPPALMQSSVGGLPPIGVCATVKQIDELENGRLQVGMAGPPACAHRRARQCVCYAHPCQRTCQHNNAAIALPCEAPAC